MDTVTLALRVLVSLGVVVALLWWVQRRSAKWASKRRSTTAIEVAGKRSLGQKASVAVVDIDGTRFVLGVTEHGVSVLHSAEAPEPVAVPEPAAAETAGDDGAEGAGPATKPDFAAVLERASGTHSIMSLDTWKAAAKSVKGNRWPR